jgi:hypothetical protein
MRVICIILFLLLPAVPTMGGGLPLEIEIQRPSTVNVIDSVLVFVEWSRDDSIFVADSSFVLEAEFSGAGEYAVVKYTAYLDPKPGRYQVFARVWMHNPYIHLWAKTYKEIREVTTNKIEFQVKVTTSVTSPISIGDHLFQNFPNPVKEGSTTIAFELQEMRRIKLVLYDILGREVLVLADGVFPSGRHYVQVSGGGLTNGVYFYVLHLGKAREVGSMVVLK